MRCQHLTCASLSCRSITCHGWRITGISVSKNRKQKQAVEALLARQDVLAIVPTRFGKAWGGDYMANFSPVSQAQLGWDFSPGCERNPLEMKVPITWRRFLPGWVSPRAENPSLVSKTGLGFSVWTGSPGGYLQYTWWGGPTYFFGLKIYALGFFLGRDLSQFFLGN